MTDDLPAVLTIRGLMIALDCGRDAAYKLVNTEQVRSVRIGNQIRIPRAAVAEFLDRRPDQCEGVDDRQRGALSVIEGVGRRGSRRPRSA